MYRIPDEAPMQGLTSPSGAEGLSMSFSVTTPQILQCTRLERKLPTAGMDGSTSISSSVTIPQIVQSIGVEREPMSGPKPQPQLCWRLEQVLIRGNSTDSATYRTWEEAPCPREGQRPEYVFNSDNSTNVLTYRTREEAHLRIKAGAPEKTEGTSKPSSRTI